MPKGQDSQQRKTNNKEARLGKTLNEPQKTKVPKKKGLARTDEGVKDNNFKAINQGFSAQSIILNRLGLHARAAARLAQAVENYDAEIYLSKGDMKADAKSILDLIGLCAPRNTKIEISSYGPEAQKALMAAVKLIEDNFGEAE
ncbi:MAG: HPr family phosphocarrier protein [Deltaproteobacteria bacterium]|jgi:phosphocarrier protein|nr:HPr family phosphocarrier protein [Deltaproteobacteria bacterium]